MAETSAGRSDIDYLIMSVPGMSAACGMYWTAIKPGTAQQTQFIALGTRAAVSVQIWTR